MSGRLCAVSVIGTYLAGDVRRAVHSLDFCEASSAEDAEAQARADFQTRHPDREIVSVLVEPVPA